MSKLDVGSVLNSLNVFSNDIIMIHGDAGVAAQFQTFNKEERLNHLMNELVTFAGTQGTIVVPTFSYSFTKQEDFDVCNTPSDVGLFSEEFRKLPIALRSKNPNFSVASVGRYAKEFQQSRVDDSFGDDTVFDLLYKLKAKIVCLGCEFDRITFVHYLEQSLGVPYRYFKNFSGKLIDEQGVRAIDTTYFVKDLDLIAGVDLSLLKKKGIDKGAVKIDVFGRFPVSSISADDFYAIGTELLKENTYALVKKRPVLE